MAVDKLVDSTKLDACCEAEAAAIIAKGGGTAPLAYDFANNKGFADAIAAITGGGAAQIATGSITPAQNVKHLDITGLNFTPKAMAVVVAPEFRNTGIQMTGAAICIYDLAIISRSNTGGTSTLASWGSASVAGANGVSITTCTVVNSFLYTSNYVERKSDAFRVTLYSDNMAFPYASGVKYDWIAIG